MKTNKNPLLKDKIIGAVRNKIYKKYFYYKSPTEKLDTKTQNDIWKDIQIRTSLYYEFSIPTIIQIQEDLK